MQINLSIDTASVSATDVAILAAISAELANDVYEGETAEAAEAAGTGTTAEQKPKQTRNRGANKPKADTATNELGNAAEPIEANTAKTEAAKPEPKVTLDDLRNLAGPIAEDEANDGNAKFVALVQKHGAQQLSKVPKENWDALYADLSALDKELKKTNALG